MTHEEMESLTAATKPVSASCWWASGWHYPYWVWGPGGVSLSMHRLSLLFSSACPLNPPFSPPLPTNGSGDQGDQLGAGRVQGGLLA